MSQTLTYPSDIRTGAELHEFRATRAVETLENGVAHSSYIDVGRSIVRDRNATDQDCLRALSSAEGISSLTGLVNTAIVSGSASVPKTWEGWTHSESLPNYQDAKAAVVEDVPRLMAVARGDTAPTVDFTVTSQGYALARYGCQFCLDEQDFLGVTDINIHQTALEEIGRAAMRIVPDLVFARILENGTLDADSKAVFHADHSNLATAALAQAALDTGIAAVENQYLVDEDNIPAHIGQAARYLVVPPNLHGLARRLARDMALGDDSDLIVRSEPRLSATGVFDPRDEVVDLGSATNWLLAASAAQRPCVIVATLNGRQEPLVRWWRLEQGTFGLGFDVQMAVAVTIADFRGLYFSDGTV